MDQRQDKAPKRCVGKIGSYTPPIQSCVLDPENDTDPHGHEPNEKSLHVLRCVLELTSCPEDRDVQRD